jgi:hypothetical protein
MMVPLPCAVRQDGDNDLDFLNLTDRLPEHSALPWGLDLQSVVPTSSRISLYVMVPADPAGFGLQRTCPV